MLLISRGGDGMDGVPRDSLYQVDAGDLGSQDLIGAYEDAYSSAMVRIRAVGDVISRGKRPRNLNVSIESIRQNVETMKQIHNAAGPLLSAESHWCCDRPRSEVMRGGVQIIDWTIALAAIGFSAAGLAEDKTNSTNSSLRSLATFGVGCMHVVQGWFSGKTFEQIAYEDDLMRMMKGSAPRIRYVESMIQTFEAWQTLQERDLSHVEAQDLSEDVLSLISALEAVPIRPKSASDKCRRDVLEGFLETRMGKRMFEASEELREYRALVEKETKRGDSRMLLEQEMGDESEEVDIEAELQDEVSGNYLKKKKKEKNPMHRMKTMRRREHARDDLRMERRSSPSKTCNTAPTTVTAAVLDEFVISKCCWFVEWNIPLVMGKIESKYRIVENEASAVGGALKRHDAGEIDFETSISALTEVLDPITTLEKVARHILDSDTSVPSAVNFRAQQRYRTLIQLGFTGGSLASSIADTVLEAKEEEPNTVLKTVSLVTLILGQVAARWDTRLQGQIFNKMRMQQTLRGLLARKYSPTIKSLIRYWESCQKAVTSGHDSDVERAFAVRVPRPMTVACSMQDVADHILKQRRGEQDQHKRALAPPREADHDLMAVGCPRVARRALPEHREVPDLAFNAKVRELATKAQRESERMVVTSSSPRTPGAHHVTIAEDMRPQWGDIDSEEEEYLAEGDWKLRLRQLRKKEGERRGHHVAGRDARHAVTSFV